MCLSETSTDSDLSDDGEQNKDVYMIDARHYNYRSETPAAAPVIVVQPSWVVFVSCAVIAAVVAMLSTTLLHAF